MENLVPLGTGNSRLMKSNIPANTTLAQLIQMWNNGTFPYDIGPLNSAGISQQGTPLNKDTLLKDSTAALYGLTNTAVPDDVLNLLSRFQSELGNEYLWGKYENKYIIDVSPSAVSYGFSDTTYSCQYSSSVSVENGGEIVLNNPTRMTLRKTNATTLKNKYFICSGLTDSNDVYYCPTAKNGGSSWSASVSYSEVSARFDYSALIEYLNSPNKDAYPPAVSDGYVYMPLGQLGARTQIATGSYVGTGTAGQNNPNTISTDFDIKFVAIIENTTQGFRTFAMKDCTYLSVFDQSSIYDNILNWNGKSISWYYQGGSDYYPRQLNSTGTTYTYVAIG